MNQQDSLDIIIVGGGAGGVPAAVRAAQLGAKTAVIEMEHIGGTCMNRGCIPTKTLLTTARMYRDVGRAADFGLAIEGARIDWDALLAKKDDTVNYLRLGTESVLKSNGVEIVRGQARFIAPDRLRVGERELASRHVVLAVGSVPRLPDIEGINSPGVLGTDDVLQLRDVPALAAVLGSGPVELELAQYLSFMGAVVYVLEPEKRILPEEAYRELSGRLGKELKDQGLHVINRAVVERIVPGDSGLAVHYEDKNGQQVLDVDCVVHAGRAPNLEGLGLEAAGLNPAGLSVDQYLRTNAPHIYAIGDAVPGPQYSHRAAAMGVRAVENALADARPFDPDTLIRGFFTSPEAAAVGLTERQAKQAGYDVITGTIPYGINAMGMIRLDTRGAVKVVAESEYRQVLGVHIVGPNATELISEGALAVEMEAALEDLAESVRYHPSLSESQVDAARESLGRGIYVLR